MKSRIALLAISILTIFVFTGCSDSDTNTTEDIGVWSITIQVDSETPIEFTNEDALTIGPKDITAAEKDQDTFLESQTWRGILMDDLLNFLGVKDFSAISIEGANGIPKEFDPDRLSGTNTGIGWMVDGVMLDEESGPIKLIADQRGPKWWITKVSTITIVS